MGKRLERFGKIAALMAGLTVGGAQAEAEAQNKPRVEAIAKKTNEIDPVAEIPVLPHINFESGSKEARVAYAKAALAILEKLFPTMQGVAAKFEDSNPLWQDQNSYKVYVYTRHIGQMLRFALLKDGSKLSDKDLKEFRWAVWSLNTAGFNIGYEDALESSIQEIIHSQKGIQNLLAAKETLTKFGNDVVATQPGSAAVSETYEEPAETEEEFIEPVAADKPADELTEQTAPSTPTPEPAEPTSAREAVEKEESESNGAETDNALIDEFNEQEKQKQAAAAKGSLQDTAAPKHELQKSEVTRPIRSEPKTPKDELRLMERNRPLPTERVFGTGLRKEFAGKPLISLTFDDGPHLTQTPEILDHLKEYGAKATFFVLGEKVVDPKYAAILKRMVDEGHEIALHSFDHSNLKKTYPDNPEAAFQEQVIPVQEALKKATGEESKIFRPPEGEISREQFNHFANYGYYIVVWDSRLDSRDWQRRSANKIEETIVAGAKPGGIALFHDAGGSSRTSTVTALPRILNKLSNKNFLFVTVSQALWLEPISEETWQLLENRLTTVDFPRADQVSKTNQEEYAKEIFSEVVNILPGVKEFNTSLDRLDSSTQDEVVTNIVYLARSVDRLIVEILNLSDDNKIDIKANMFYIANVGLSSDGSHDSKIKNMIDDLKELATTEGGKKQLAATHQRFEQISKKFLIDSN